MTSQHDVAKSCGVHVTSLHVISGLYCVTLIDIHLTSVSVPPVSVVAEMSVRVSKGQE